MGSETICCGCNIFKTNMVLIVIEVVLSIILGISSLLAGGLGFVEGPVGFLSIIMLVVELYGTIEKNHGFIMIACGWRIFRIFLRIIVIILLVLIWTGTIKIAFFEYHDEGSSMNPEVLLK